MQIRIIINKFAKINRMKDPRDIIKATGLKATPQRLAIYKAMLNIGHASADMIIEYLVKEELNLTIATVYNVLESFEKTGIIRKLSSDGIKMYYDINTTDHPHIFCEESNTFMDYNMGSEELINSITKHIKKNKIKDFDVNGIEVLIKGKFNNK